MQQRHSFPAYHSPQLSAPEGSSTCSDHVSTIGSSRSAKSKATTNTSYSSPSEWLRSDERKRIPQSGYEYVIENAVSPTISLQESSASFTSHADSEASSSVLDSDESMDLYDDVRVSDSSLAIASTPRNFASYFPSANRIAICHDDSTLDGNMNLRLDTTVFNRYGERKQLTLFHLRMRDLKTRDFSLRRYCRDSGREVCHSLRKPYVSSSSPQASVVSYLSNAFSSIRRFSHAPPRERPHSSWEHQDSEDEDNEFDAVPKTEKLSNDIHLEFSNYTHLDVRPRGNEKKKCYEFEYWGLQYAWKRTVKDTGRFTEISYHLFRSDEEQALAHIVPFALTTRQARDEARRGGWVAPCSMWISDERIVRSLPDVAEYVQVKSFQAPPNTSIA
jgi:hypothetical protein